MASKDRSTYSKIYINQILEENKAFRLLVEYTIKDLQDLGWDYDRMSTSGQQTYDRLSRMYAMKLEGEDNAVSQ
tara:strand:- start:946 stop:1167 length:222 start_codon:yes stop_codon:yes gene_type:complete